MGLKYEDVAKAADELESEGVEVTYDNVRARVGNTGSRGTIGKHLKKWRLNVVKEVSPEDISGLHEEIVDAVRQVSVRLTQESERQTEMIRKEMSQQVDEAQAALKKSEHSVEAGLTRIRELENLFNRANEANAALEEKLGNERLSRNTAEAKLDEVELQRSNLKQELSAYRDQLKNHQENFSHYQETISLERQKQTEQFLHTQKLFESQIQKLNTKLEESQTKTTLLERSLNDVENEKKALVLENNRLQQEILAATNMVNERGEVIAEGNREVERLKNDASVFRITIAELEEAARGHDRERETLSELVTLLRSKLDVASARIDALSDDKLSWVQERTRLESHIESLEKNGSK